MSTITHLGASLIMVCYGVYFSSVSPREDCGKCSPPRPPRLLYNGRHVSTSSFAVLLMLSTFNDTTTPPAQLMPDEFKVVITGLFELLREKASSASSAAEAAPALEKQSADTEQRAGEGATEGHDNAPVGQRHRQVARDN